MKKESWRMNHGEGIVEEGIMEDESWPMHHGGVIKEEAAGRRHQEAPRSSKSHAGDNRSTQGK